MCRTYIFKEFLCVHVVNRQQRTRSQIAEKEREPEAANRDGYCQIEQVSPAEGKCLIEVRFDVPEQVHKSHEQEPARQPDQSLRVSLELPRKQQQEWHAKVEDDQRERNGLPTGIQTPSEEINFRRQISRPDDQQLREAEV